MLINIKKYLEAFILHFIALAVFIFSVPTFGQWPKGGSSTEESAHKYSGTGGCYIRDAQLPVLLSSIRYTVIISGNDADNEIFRGLQNADRLIGRAFGVDVVYGLYSDESPNAFATAKDIAEMGNRDGTVLIGRKLVQSERHSNPQMWTASLTYVLAHEYAHSLQFKRGLDLKNPDLELHADYLAGWWLGQENAKHSAYYTDMSVVISSILAKGSYAFNSPEFHGTARQRREALNSGYNSGYEGKTLGSAFRDGIRVAQRIADNAS